MKITKDNKVILSPAEKRVGNYIVKEEKAHMKVSDLGGLFTHRFAKSTAIGAFIYECYSRIGSDGDAGRGLGNWIAILFSVTVVVPDTQFLSDVYKASEDCLKRHPEIYGEPAQDPDPGQDADIIKGMREMVAPEGKEQETAPGPEAGK